MDIYTYMCMTNMYIYGHTCTHVYPCMSAYIDVYLYKYIHTHACMHARMCVICVCMYIYTCMYVFIQTDLYLPIYIPKCVFMSRHVHIYAHA